MLKPLGFQEKIAFLPPAYHSVLRLSPEATFDQWRLALSEAGFLESFQSQSHSAAWPEGLDPMGPPPAPQQPETIQRHSLMHHPDGFVITLASGPALNASDGHDHQPANPLAELVIYHQTNLGADIYNMRRGAFGSGGSSSLGDGVSLYIGHERMGSDPRVLAYFLAECHHEARPTPLAQWERLFIHTEVGLFSPAPANSALGGPTYAALRERFTERLKRDWSSFTQSLPAEIACRVSAPGAVIPRPSGGPKKPHSLYDSSTESYWANQLSALGLNWPSDRDSAIMRSWNSSIGRARSDKEGLAPLVFDQSSERVLGGSNPMHAIACLHSHPVDAAASVSLARLWLDSLTQESAQQWLSQRDALGRTPVGVAFETWMRDGALARDEPSPPSVIDLFLERGWLGAPGELGQIAHDILSEPPPSWSYSPTYACLGHAMALDRVERAASRFRHEWLAPLNANGEIKLTRAEGLEALLGKFTKADAPTRAYLEALSLRAELSRAPAPSNAPRL